MKLLKNILFVCIAIQMSGCTTTQTSKSPADYVNPFIGASTSTGAAGTYHGLGKTFPGATVPYGMVQVSPNTITGGDNGSGYSYEHTTIEGFAFTQMSGIGWYGDLGNFLVMPTTGKLKVISGDANDTETGYRSHYDKESEKASAGYYSVELTDYNVRVEATAALRSGLLKFTFPESKESRIQIDLARRVGGTSSEQYVKVVNENTIEGWMKCTPDGGGWGDGDGDANYTVYFYAQFSKPLKNYGVWSADIPEDWKRKRDDVTSASYQNQIAKAEILKDITEIKGNHLGFFTEFETTENENVLLKSGISFVNIEGAKENLENDIQDWDFENVKSKAKVLWDDALSKMEVTGGTEDEKVVFYTALYHTMIDPRIFQDVNGNYIGGDNEIHKPEGFTKRTIFSGWDVFRSQMPLQTIINPALVNDMVNSLVTLADEKEKNYLERWEFLNAYSGCMIGNPAVSVIADAHAKGIRGFDVEKAYDLSVNSVEKFGNEDRGYAYEPFGISNTLEYAYFEWCVAQLAKSLGKNEDETKYLERSMSYKNIFDKEKDWFRPRDKNGDFLPWPKEGRLEQWYGSIECNAYQQGWFVPQDIDGMVNIMGGKEKVLKDLTHFFEQTPESMLWNNYYNHANEPVHHVSLLFNRVDAPWLTQEWTRKICDRAYKNSVEGLVGNEDVGQMSAWYVLAASGIYPITPGSTRYEITSPVFSKIEINLDASYYEGSKFIITAKDNNSKNVYIQSATLNGKKYDKSYLDHDDIVNGGELVLQMGEYPNKEWGAQH